MADKNSVLSFKNLRPQEEEEEEEKEKLSFKNLRPKEEPKPKPDTDSEGYRHRVDIRRRGAGAGRRKDTPRQLGRDLYPEVFPEREAPSPVQSAIDTLRGGTPKEVVKAYEEGKGGRDSWLGKLAGSMNVLFGEDVGRIKALEEDTEVPLTGGKVIGFNAARRKIAKNQKEFHKQFPEGSKARLVGDTVTGIANESVNLIQTIGGTRGGLATLGFGGVLRLLKGGGKVTSNVTHATFATTIMDGVNESKDQVADVFHGVNEDGTPKYSVTEKAETAFGITAAAAFTAALTHGTVKDITALKKHGIRKNMPPQEAAKALRELPSWLVPKGKGREAKLGKMMEKAKAEEVKPSIEPKRIPLLKDEPISELTPKVAEAQQLERMKGDKPIGEEGKEAVSTPDIPIKEVEASPEVPLRDAEAAPEPKPMVDPVIRKDLEIRKDPELMVDPVIRKDLEMGRDPEIRKDQPVVEALKEEKIEDAALKGPPVAPPTPPEVAEAMGEPNLGVKTIVKRSIDRLRAEGTKEASELADLVEADPRSYYEVLPSREISKSVGEITDINQINDLIAGKNAKSIETMLMTQKENILYDKWKKGEVPESEYRDALEATAEKGKHYGQQIEQMKHLREGRTDVILDRIDAIRKKEGLPVLEGSVRKDLTKLIDASREANKRKNDAEEVWIKDKSDKNFHKAYDAFVEAENAVAKQYRFLADYNPKLWTDIYVSHLQGNFLTPATLAVNVVGNIVPVPLRAMSRAMTKGIDLFDNLLLSKGRKSELDALKEEFSAMEKTDPARKKVAQDIARLQAKLEPQIGLSPVKGTFDKWAKGFAWEGWGLKRLKKTLGAVIEGDTVKAKRELNNAAYDDALSSLVFGQRVNQYEVGSTSPNPIPTSPMNHHRAWYRMYKKQTPRSLRDIGDFAKDFVEGTTGAAPDMIFRFLAMGDLPFRRGETHRLIREYGESKGWSDGDISKAQLHPELLINKKDLARIRNEGLKATFQNENAVTEFLAGINQWLKKPTRKGKSSKVTDALGRTAYAGYRTITPYQKTLVNILGEHAGYTPLGFMEFAIRGSMAKDKGGFASRDAKMALGRAMTGTTLYFATKLMMEKGIIEVQPEMTGSDETGERYLADSIFPHGSINLTKLEEWAGGYDRKGDEKHIRKGDKIRGLERGGGPLGYMLLANAALAKQMEDMPEEQRKKIEDSWIKMMWQNEKGRSESVGEYILHKSFATNLRRLVSNMAHNDVNEWWDKALRPIAEAMPTAVVPNTADWFYNKNSKYKRRYKADSFDEALITAYRKKMGALGLLELDDPFHVDMWGRRLRSLPHGAKEEDRLTHHVFGTMAAREMFPDPESNEVYRLWRDSNDSLLAPAPLSKHLEHKGETYDLNKDQYAMLQELVGRARLNGVPRIQYSPAKGGGIKMEIHQSLGGVKDWVNDFGGKRVANTPNGMPDGLKWVDRPDFTKRVDGKIVGVQGKDDIIKDIFKKARAYGKNELFKIATDESYKQRFGDRAKQYSWNLDKIQDLKPVPKRSGRIYD